MKRFSEKVLSGAIAFILTFSNFGLLGNGIMSVIAEDTAIEEISNKIDLSYNISKYVQYENEKYKGVLVQEKIYIKQKEDQNNHYQVLKNKMEITVPKINNQLPEINVIANSTESTNGKLKFETDFSEENWKYNEETKKIEINYENKDNYNEYKENSIDEFEITYNYPESSYSGYENPVELPIEISLNRTLKNNKEKIDINKEVSEIKKLEEKIGNIVSYNIEEIGEIYKGYMYTSKIKNMNKETQYETKDIINISNINMIDKIEAKKENTTYKTLESEEGLDAKEVTYKQSKINKNCFDKIIGKDGFIEIYTNENIKLYTVEYYKTEDEIKLIKEDKEGKKEEIQNSEIILNYPTGIRNIKIKTSKPISCGEIEIINTKTISGETEKELFELQSIKQLVEKTEVIGIKAVEKEDINENDSTLIQICKNEEEKLIETKEPTKKVEWEISQNNWTILENNKIKINATLRDNDSQFMLFNSPVLRIDLPEALIDNINGQVSLLYGNGLEIENSIINKKNIEIQIKGEQNDYSSSETEGTKLVIELDVSMKKNIPTQKANLKLNCIENNKVITTQNKEIKLQSKESVLMINNIKYADKSITTYNSNERVGEITVGDNKEVEQSTEILNDYDYEISDVEIIEEVITQNKENNIYIQEIKTNEDIIVSYSEDGINFLEKDKVKDFNKIGFYKISLINPIKSKELKELKINYNIIDDINAGSIINIKTLVKYKIKQTNLSEESNIKLKVNKSIVKNMMNSFSVNNTQNEEVQKILDKLDIDMQILVDDKALENNEQLKQGQYFKYKVTVANNSGVDMQGLKISSIVENLRYYELRNDKLEGTRYYESDESNIREKETDIKANEKFSWEYEVVVKNDAKDIKNTIQIGLQNQTKKLERVTNVEEAKIKLNIEYEFNYEVKVSDKSYFTFFIHVTNLTNEEIKDLPLSCDIPELLRITNNMNSYEDYGISKVENTDNNITWTLASIGAKEKKTILIRTKPQDIPLEKLGEEVSLKIYSNYDNKMYNSNTLKKYINQADAGITAEVVEDNKEYTIKHGDEREYTIEVKNKGKQNLNDVQLIQNLDKGLEIESAALIREDGSISDMEISNVNSLEYEFSLKSEEKVTIKIKIKANQSEMQTDATQLLNEITIICKDNKEKIFSKNYIIRRVDFEDGDGLDDKENPEDPDNPDNPDIKDETKEINGIVWLDENKNGKREEKEYRFPNIKVSIFNKKTKELHEVLTDENGTYSLKVKPSTYIIIFEFDTDKYNLAEYQKQGIEDGINSDVILSNVTLNGITKKMAVTNEIVVDKSNVNNIDMGLIEKQKFDLSLEKSITKVVVKNNKETRTINYKQTKLAKVDLVAKYINNTNVFIEYTFTIKNNGDVPGYVGKIKDNIPNGLSFSSEIDKDWYKGSDGMLYNNELSNTVINPGDTKQVTLTLEKQMNGEETGTIRNTANIQEIKNLSGIDDEDNSNNKDTAEVILSIKTGSPAMYISISLMCIAIIGTGAYIINKKVLKD